MATGPGHDPNSIIGSYLSGVWGSESGLFGAGRSKRRLPALLALLGTNPEATHQVIADTPVWYTETGETIDLRTLVGRPGPYVGQPSLDYEAQKLAEAVKAKYEARELTPTRMGTSPDFATLPDRPTQRPGRGGLGGESDESYNRRLTEWRKYVSDIAARNNFPVTVGDPVYTGRGTARTPAQYDRALDTRQQTHDARVRRLEDLGITVVEADRPTAAENLLGLVPGYDLLQTARAVNEDKLISLGSYH